MRNSWPISRWELVHALYHGFRGAAGLGRIMDMKAIENLRVYFNDNDVPVLDGIITIDHPVSLKEGNLKEVHKGLMYKVRVEGMKVEDLFPPYAADRRIYYAGRLRKTSDAFVKSIRGKEFEGFEALDAEIALHELDDSKLEALEKQLLALMARRGKKVLVVDEIVDENVDENVDETSMEVEE